MNEVMVNEPATALSLNRKFFHFYLLKPQNAATEISAYTEMHKTTAGFGIVLPTSQNPFANLFSQMAFLGLEWPKKELPFSKFGKKGGDILQTNVHCL